MHTVAQENPKKLENLKKPRGAAACKESLRSKKQ